MPEDDRMPDDHPGPGRLRRPVPVDEAPSPTRHFATTVKRYRALQGWTQPQLAERCQEAGLEWDRSIIANVEAGRRASVSVVEVLTLAFVFGVPPILMIFPVGAAEFTEVLPGEVMETWEAARWFTGEGYPPSMTQPPLEDPYIVGRAPVDLFREHWRWLAEYQMQGEMEEFGEEPQPPGIAARNALRELKANRAAIRRHGLTPPALPEWLSHIDERKYRYLSPGEAVALRDRGVPVQPVDFSSPEGETGDQKA